MQYLSIYPLSTDSDYRFVCNCQEIRWAPFTVHLRNFFVIIVRRFTVCAVALDIPYVSNFAHHCAVILVCD